MPHFHCCMRAPYAKRIISRCNCFRIFADWSSELEREAQEIKPVLSPALPLLSALLLEIFKKDEMLTCEEAAKRLYEYLDEEISPADYDKITLHLELCRICCKHFEFEEIIRSIIRNKTRSEKMPSLIKEKILKEMEMQDKTRL